MTPDLSNFSLTLFNPQQGEHRGKKVIWVLFQKNFNTIKILRKATKAYWSQSQKAWYVSDSLYNRKLFKIPTAVHSPHNYQSISEINLPEFQKFKDQLILKGFSANTQKTYTTEFAQLLYILKNHSVAELSADKLRSYLLYCHKELKLSENQIHSRMNALKFYFEKVLKREKIFFDIPRPKKQKILPKALSQEDIKKIISKTENIKHLLIIKLCYGMGLRVSEIVNLKIQDIDSAQMRVFIERAKGKKDRYVNLPESILEDLRKYYKEYRPKVYLFEGRFGEQYTIRSAQQVFKTAMNKAGIDKKVGIHTLRHSYATHLLELGTDISLIQKLLGHSNIKTTLIYTNVTDQHLNRVISPLDSLK